ncbi:dipeptidase [Halovulum sp. GXIMD14793]
MDRNSPRIFDGHNDLILRLMRGQVTPEGVVQGLVDGHIDLPRARQGGFGGGFFAVYVPDPPEIAIDHDEMAKSSYDLPLSPALAQDSSLDFIRRGFDMLDALEAAGGITLCRTAAELEAALQRDRMAAIAHIEGAEAIDPDFAVLHELHGRGLRSLGPVWSRPTAFGHGVPFRYPSDPDTGPGLTDAGKALVRECNQLRIMLDLSHLNEKGFDDVAALSDAPLVATHSNAWALCPHARNLTDWQLRVIAESDGMVGLNFAAAFLRQDGKMDADVPLETMLQHLDHMIDMMGEDRVGFGTDFDGAVVPQKIKDCAGFPHLRAAMRAHGYNEPLMTKLCHGNWLRVLRKTWGA